MINKDNENGSSITDEIRTFNNRFSLNKMDYDLYHDEKNTVEKIIRVKRISSPVERWKIFEDQKLIFIIEGSKINKKEKTFLRTLDGVNFIIETVKSGILNFSALKSSLKAKLAHKEEKPTSP